MTGCTFRPPYVEYTAVLLTLLSIELTQVITDELAKQSSVACDDDRKTIACPLPCYCRAPNYRSVRCDAGGLTSVPSSVWTVVPVSLNLSFNGIAEWTGIDVTVADDSRVACLRTLILGHSGVTRIRPRAFERLRELRHLTIDHNHITMLDSDTFVGLRHLELLDVSHNDLVFLPQTLFNDLTQLKVHVYNTNCYFVCQGGLLDSLNQTLLVVIHLRSSYLLENKQKSLISLVVIYKRVLVYAIVHVIEIVSSAEVSSACHYHAQCHLTRLSVQWRRQL